MSANTPPMQYALLVAALLQVLPVMAYAAKVEKEASESNDAKVCEDSPDPSGQSAWIEAGIGLQSNDAYHFGRYSGHQSEGTTVNLNGEVSYRGKLDGAWFNGTFVDLGLNSRLMSVEGGRQGLYSLGLEYDEIPNYRKELPHASLETQRDRLGVKFSMVTGKAWEVTGHFRHENKEGTRDNAASFAMSNPQILAVPIDYQTNDFGIALGYQGERLQARFAYDGSQFNNGHDAISWDNPSIGSATGSPAIGQIAETPDNQSHQFSAQLGYQLSSLTRLGASFSRGSMTQNQTFLPYGTASALVLPANSLNGEVDTTAFKLDINSRPTPRVRLDASYAYNDRDNNTPINSYSTVIAETEPVTGLSRLNRPYGFEQTLIRLKAAYRFTQGTDLSAGFDDDKMQRTYRQAEETQDKTLWVKLKAQPLDNVETAIKVSHANRDASAYDATIYQNPNFPNSGANPVDPLIKPFEIADRSRDKIGFDVTYAGKENLNLGMNVSSYKDDYKNMALGLTEASGVSLTPNLSYTFNDRLSASAYYTWDKLKSDQSGREWVAFPTPIPSYSVLWLEANTNLIQTVGLSAQWKAIPDKLDITADVVYADFSGKMQYASGGDLPELTSSLTALGLHGVYKIKDNLSFRVDYRYEKYEEYDWANINLPTIASLGVSPTEQETHLIYLAVRYTFK